MAAGSSSVVVVYCKVMKLKYGKRGRNVGRPLSMRWAGTLCAVIIK